MSAQRKPQHVEPGSPFLQVLANRLRFAKKIVSITGAGISTAAGLRDYRSADGIYIKGALFSDAAFLGADRANVFQKALEFRDQATGCQPTATHRWLVSLGPKLRRWYTQNVDMLEERAGLQTGVGAYFRCVPLHRSLAGLKCRLCNKSYDWEIGREDIDAGLDLPCRQCTDCSDARQSAGKRPLPIGLLRPSVVMLDEEQPQGAQLARLITRDCIVKPEVLLIMGTSLKADGPRDLARRLARWVRTRGGKVVYVNDCKPASSWSSIVDYWVDWKCDDWVVTCCSVRASRSLGGRRRANQARTRGVPLC